MNDSKTWLLYGAGRVSEAVGRLLTARGIPFVLAGRTKERVEQCANKLDVGFRVGDVGSVNDALLLTSHVVGVINTAGPLRETAPCLMRACIASGAHYIDVSNEADVHRIAWSLGPEARRAEVAVVSGAGPGTLAAESLVNSLAPSTGGAHSALLVSLPSAGAHKSPGVVATESAVLSGPPLVVTNGAVRRLDGSRVRPLPPWVGPATSLIVGTGDLIALAHSSGLREVKVAVGLNYPAWAVKAFKPVILAKARKRSRSPESSANRSRSIQGSESDLIRKRLVAEVRGDNGVVARGALHSGSGTKGSAQIVAAIVAELTEKRKVGTFTPHQILGSRMTGSGNGFSIEALPSSGE